MPHTNKKLYMKRVVLTAVVFFSFVSVASAHVVVKPVQVGIGTFQTFSIGVPVEKNSGTIGVRLILPAGLEYVTPNVKPGWNIVVKKNGQGTSSMPIEIIWTGGYIPAGQRDDFVFSAKVPSATTTLQWKAYQSYQDGTVISWDKSETDQPKNESGMPDFSKFGPYSETKVIDDLVVEIPAKEARNTTALTFSLVSFVFSIAALNIARRQK